MDAIGRYLLQIVAAAILCSILGSLCDKSAFSPAIRMILGVVMLISVLQPIMKLRMDDLSLEIMEITYRGDDIIDQGRDSAEDAVTSIISDRISAYIEDKASRWGADIIVQIDTKEGVPVTATIAGDVPPYIRSQLSAWIVSEIGIEREAQNWS